MHAALAPEVRQGLARLDRALEREILRLRARYQLSLDELRGLYVSDEQVDALIRDALGDRPEAQPTPQDWAPAAAADGSPAGPHSRWGELVARLDLDRSEAGLVLLALAPEVELKYETLYAYLNNDVTRKWPTLDLAQRLLGTTAAPARAVAVALSPAGRLARLGALERIDPPTGRPSLRNAGFALAPLVTQFLLELPPADPRLAGIAELADPAGTPGDPDPMAPGHAVLVERLASLYRSAGPGAAALALVGEPGSGRLQMATAVCGTLGIGLLRLNLGALREPGEAHAGIGMAVGLLRRLYPAGLYLEGIESLCGPDASPQAEASRLLDPLLHQGAPIFVACSPQTAWQQAMQARRTLVIRLDNADYPRRLAEWEHRLGRAGIDLPAAERGQLASRLPLSPGQTQAVIDSALDLAVLAGTPSVDLRTLIAAARDRADQGLGNLASKVESRHDWDDLVLPTATLGRVRELAGAIRNRHLVYEQWGFGRRITTGTGLKVLFTGASGTGKTMTAGVVARDLGFDLYKIDLSGIVSKYIGETEKNLDRIFRAARAANAIIFLDEAEALLGKRSEVKDAHDRYANIEVAYLLQKLEEHDGVVILATNLRRNIDDAFSRRMHYVIDFQVPDAPDRRRLWRGMFPAEVPLAEDVDLDFLARQFELAGGDIRNVALEAAFLAAQDGRLVTMGKLIGAMARQMVKQGRMPSPTDFKQYHALIAQGD